MEKTVAEVNGHVVSFWRHGSLNKAHLDAQRLRNGVVWWGAAASLLGNGSSGGWRGGGVGERGAANGEM